jgi:hypothetical protein
MRLPGVICKCGSEDIFRIAKQATHKTNMRKMRTLH